MSLRCLRCVWYCRSNSAAVLVVVMLVYPHEILQNQPLGIEGMTVQDNSWRSSRRLLRVAAPSNPSINTDWRDDAAPGGYVGPYALQKGMKDDFRRALSQA